MVSYTHEVKKKDLLNFENLILRLMETHNIIDPEDFFNFYEKGSEIPERAILMTFDDGFLSSYETAITILKKYKIKAIFFIPTKILELKTEFDMLSFTNSNIYYNKSTKSNRDEYLFINVRQLNDLVDHGHFIAAHTHNHVIIKNITDDSGVITELINPKNVLSNYVKQKWEVFAFPVGTEKQVSRYIYSHIKSKYDYCFTTLVGINRFNTDRHCLHRFNLPPDSTLSYLDSVLKGSFNFYYGLKMFILKVKCNVR
jgi:peptidoglycan/xylan/chitin deacetylase (PgdA/CDA1 family)